jgi:hypothetical protein
MLLSSVAQSKNMAKAGLTRHGCITRDFGPGDLREQTLLHDSMRFTRTRGTKFVFYNR